MSAAECNVENMRPYLRLVATISSPNFGISVLVRKKDSCQNDATRLQVTQCRARYGRTVGMLVDRRVPVGDIGCGTKKRRESVEGKCRDLRAA